MGDVTLINKVRDFGFEIDTLKLDERVHRFVTGGKRHKKNGWYIGKSILLSDGKSLDIVTVGDWTSSEKKTFTSRDKLTDSERIQFSRESKRMQSELEKTEREKKKLAAARAVKAWETGVAVDKNFEYLVAKNISILKPIDSIRMTADGRMLMIPVVGFDQNIKSIQYIKRDGDKRFLPDGETRGGFFLMPGLGDRAVVCEGFATGASIFAALGGDRSVFVAFNAANLKLVTAHAINICGVGNVIVAADNDQWSERNDGTPFNAGVHYATECKDVGAGFVVPVFKSLDGRPTDFNDLMLREGFDAVRKSFERNSKTDFLTANVAVAPVVVDKAVEIVDNSGDDCLWPSKETGFFVQVMNGRGELKEEPRFMELAHYFRNELGLRASDSYLLIWNGTHYERIERNAVNKMIIDLTMERVKPWQFDQFFKTIKSECDDNSMTFLEVDGFINLKNGVLSVATGELLPHNKIYDFRYTLPYDFDPEAKCSTWSKYLDEVFIGDKDLIGLTQEIFGYTVLGGKPYLHKAFMLYGTGRNGKSVFLDTLRGMLGESNCSSTPIDSLGEKFSRSDLMGKIANLAGETERREIASGVFKAIVGGDSIKASFKGKDEFNFSPQCRMFFSGNFYPTFKDSSAGMNERLVIIPFVRYFKTEERDTGLTEKIIAELPGVFNWALLGLARLRERGYLPSVRSVNELKEEYQIASCSVFGFMHAKCAIGECGAWTKLTDFYKNYQDYCIEMGTSQKSKISFAMTLSGYLLKDFGNAAIRKNRERFAETQHLSIFGQMRLADTLQKNTQSADTSQTRVIKNYAPNAESIHVGRGGIKSLL